MVTLEARRRSITKTLMWRVIGIAWTWAGAYLILLFAPARYRTAAWIATFIVIYHHSTRMIMYYFYERLWDKVEWGRSDVTGQSSPPLSAREKLAWTVGTSLALALILFLILYVTPLLEK